MASQFAVDLVLKTQGLGKLKGLTGETNKFQSAAKKAQGSTDKLGRALGGVGAKAGLAANGINKTGRASRTAAGSINRLSGAFTKLAIGIGAAALAQKSLQAGIRREESTRRLTLLSRGYGEVAKVQDVAAKAAAKFGQSQTEASQGIATIYARLRPMGTSLEDITAVYNGFNTAARLSGANAQEAAGAFRQLAQGLGSGALRGDEFNSIAEQVPSILTAISKETGIAEGKLRDFAAEGKISSDIVLRALKRIEKEGAGQLEEALGGPAQAIKDFQNATEDVQVALTESVIPELATSFRDLAELIRNLEGPIRFIGRVASDTIKEINGLIDLATRAPSAAARRSVERGQLPASANLLNPFEGAEKLFGKKEVAALRDQAQEYAKLRNQKPNEVLIQLMQDRLKAMDGSAYISSIDNLTQEVKNNTVEQKKTDGSKGTAAAIAPRATFISIEELGRALQGMGYTVKEHPSFGGISGGHAPNSYHKYGEALDVTDHRSGDWMGRTKQLENQLRGAGAGFAELMGPASGAAGHETHIHIAAASGKVQLTPELAAVLGLPGAGERGASALQVMNQQAEAMMQNLAQGRQTIEGIVSDMQGGTQGLQDEFDNSQLRDRLELEGMASQEIAIQIERADRLRNIQRQQETALAKLLELQASGKITEDQKLATEQQITAELQKQAGLIESLATANTARAQNATTELTEVQQLSQSISDSLEGGIVNALGTGITALATGAEDLDKKLQQILQGVLADIANQLLKFAMSRVFKGIGGGGAGGIFGGFFADGGTLPGNSISVVGENGPELADTRGGSTNIIPMSDAMSRYSMGGGSKAGADGGSGGAGGVGEAGSGPVYNFQTTQFMDKEWVDRDQLVAAMDQAAQRGAAGGKAQTLGTLRNSRTQRAKLGL